MAARDLSPLCGDTPDEAECRCGCTGYDERCAYYMFVYEMTDSQVRMHRCCQIPGRDA